jgi:hypothetical protein
MLSTIPGDLMQEIRAAEELRKRFLGNTAQLVRRYVGNWYRTDTREARGRRTCSSPSWPTMLPELVFDNPAVTVSAKRSFSHAAIARRWRWR